MLNYDLDSKDRIIKAKVALTKDRPFFAYILMNMNIERTQPDSTIPSMGVNAWGDLFWNDDFVKKLTDEELTGVLAHESMHPATLTFQRQGKRDHMIWNMATDIVINYMLLDEGFKLPQDCLRTNSGVFEFTGKDKKKYTIDVKEKTAEDVYDWLMQHIEIVKDKYSDGKGGYKGQFDSHLPGDADSKGKSQGKQKGDADVRSNEENWKAKTTEAATAAKARGSMSASMERALGNLLEPKIDWRKRLQSFITKDIPVDYTMRRPGRRFYTTGVYYPSVIRENLEVIVCVDISGSIGGDEYNEFISEAIGIAGSFNQIKMRMLWWGTEIDERDDMVVNSHTKESLLTYKPHGGGGTTMSCIKPYIESKGYNSRIYVILTDGYIESTPKLPEGVKILFVLSKNGSHEIVEKYGEVCSLKDVERHIDMM